MTTVPTLNEATAKAASEVLQEELHILNDLALVLKHAHWNVTGSNFIAVHEMLDPEIEAVRDAVDGIAERIATLGYAPNGLASHMVDAIKDKTYWYKTLGKASTETHLKEIDEAYTIVETHLRESIAKLDELDLVSSNILQDALGNLELFQWKVRSHLA